MAKNKSIRRISNKKRGRPKVRFSIWGLLLIFVLSFATCFILYMVAANYNDDFFSEEFDKIVVEEKTVRLQLTAAITVKLLMHRIII